MKPQIVALPLALLMTLPAYAQKLPHPARRAQLPPAAVQENGDEIRSIIAGEKFPLTLKLKDIDSGWRRLNIGSGLEAAPQSPPRPATGADFFDADNFASTLISHFGGSPDVYLTQGSTVKQGGDSFLVAYRVRLDRQAIQTFEDSFLKDGPPSFSQLTRLIEMFVQERPLDLVLLNLRMVGRLTDIRPFRFQDQMALLNTRLRGEFGKATNKTSTSSLILLGQAVRQYISDKDGVLPPLQNPNVARSALMPYARSEMLFIYPGQTKQLYATNPTLSEKKLAHFAKYQSMLVVVYEPVAAPDGTRAVLFLDGRVKRIKETEWPQLKKVSKIPDIPKSPVAGSSVQKS